MSRFSDDNDVLPRSLIKFIKKSVAKWEKGEVKDLVTLLIDSHEEMRSELYYYKMREEMRQTKRKKMS